MHNPTELKAHDKVTIYKLGAFGVKKYECRRAQIKVGKYAQYAAAVSVQMLLPRKRKWVGYVDTYKPSTLVLSGWGHPNPPSALTKPKDEGFFVTQKSRFSSFAPEYGEEFNTMIDGYIAGSDATVVADWRGTSCQ